MNFLHSSTTFSGVPGTSGSLGSTEASIFPSPGRWLGDTPCSPYGESGKGAVSDSTASNGLAADEASETGVGVGVDRGAVVSFRGRERSSQDYSITRAGRRGPVFAPGKQASSREVVELSTI